jgi:hypothetical protein
MRRGENACSRTTLAGFDAKCKQGVWFFCLHSGRLYPFSNAFAASFRFQTSAGASSSSAVCGIILTLAFSIIINLKLGSIIKVQEKCV